MILNRFMKYQYLNKPFTNSEGVSRLHTDLASGRKKQTKSLLQRLVGVIVSKREKESLQQYQNWAEIFLGRSYDYIKSIEFTHCTLF